VRRSFFLPLLAVLLLGGTLRPTSAQSGPEPIATRSPRADVRADVSSPSPGRSAVRSRSHLSIWVGHSVGAGFLLGTIREGRVSLFGLRYAHVLIPTSAQNTRAFDGPSLTYTADLVPAARLYIPGEAMPDRVYRAGQSPQTGLTTYGAGAYPLGLRLTFRDGRPLRPFLAGQTGALYFSEAVPDSRGRQLNFAAGIGAGLQVSLPRHSTLTIGYRYHHLSNGFRGSINPGIDANVLYLEVGVDL